VRMADVPCRKCEFEARPAVKVMRNFLSAKKSGRTRGGGFGSIPARGKQNVLSMLVADRRWLTIWHGDWPDGTLLGLVPEVTG